MTYDFSSLSPADFEDLSRDLIGREINVRFEAFSSGPDGGIDGRHASAKQSIILQVKHLVRSQFATLKSGMKRERKSIDLLKPKRYILSTSRRLTPANKDALKSIIGPSLKGSEDIYGPTDLNHVIRKFPDIERSHIKLWLSGTAILERIIRSSAFAYTATSRAEIEAKFKVYAQNPSFKEARDRLEKIHVLIISGPPGVGKTTLAEILSYTYIGNEWEFIAIRSLDDGFASIIDAKKQIFFFDDFLGKVALDARALASKDSELARFIKRIRKSPNARFILTTRAYIFEEARRVSEYLMDTQIEITKYILDVGIYTRRIKSRILYNHLFVSNTPKDHIKALVVSGILPKIIDHKNYNPRIVEWMTDNLRISDVAASDYPGAFLNALDNPSQIWDTAFRTHIQPRCQNLLFSLFFCSEYGAQLDDLKTAFESLHTVMSKKYGHPYAAKDFHEAVKILEGSFISISDSRVSFINPSVRDYLTTYLKDITLIRDFAASAQTSAWARSLWRYFLKSSLDAAGEKRAVAHLFIPLAQNLYADTVRRSSQQEISKSEDIELILEWWEASESNEFANATMSIVIDRRREFSPWRDGVRLVRLIEKSRSDLSDSFPDREIFVELLEAEFVRVLQGWIPSDDLEKIADEIDLRSEHLSSEIMDAINVAIGREIDGTEENVSTMNSESSLDDYLKVIRKLSARVGAATDRVMKVVKAVEERVEEIRERTIVADDPEVEDQNMNGDEKFDDIAIMNLFSPLIG